MLGLTLRKNTRTSAKINPTSEESRPRPDAILFFFILCILNVRTRTRSIFYVPFLPTFLFPSLPPCSLATGTLHPKTTYYHPLHSPFIQRPPHVVTLDPLSPNVVYLYPASVVGLFRLATTHDTLIVGITPSSFYDPSIVRCLYVDSCHPL